MNKLALILGGGVVGGVVGYLIADYFAYKLSEEMYDVFVDEHVVEELQQQVGGMDTELYRFTKEDNEQVNYAGLTKTMIEDKPKLDELVRQEQYSEEKEPYVMTLEEWEETMNAFARQTILYYEMDGVYCTDQEEIVDDPTNMFVPNAFLHFGEGSKDSDVVYICNPNRSEMYEILRMKASYQADVLGESPPEEPPKKARTRKPRESRSGSKTEKEAEELGGNDDTEPGE